MPLPDNKDPVMLNADHLIASFLDADDIDGATRVAEYAQSLFPDYLPPGPPQSRTRQAADSLPFGHHPDPDQALARRRPSLIRLAKAIQPVLVALTQALPSIAEALPTLDEVQDQPPPTA